MNNQDKLDMYKTLDRLEETRAAFWSRNSDGTITINFRCKEYGVQPRDTASLVENYFLTLGVRCLDFPSHCDRMSGHLVLKFTEKRS